MNRTKSNIWSAWLLSLPQGNPRGGFYTAPTRTSRMIMICLDRPQIMTTMTTRIAGMKRNRNKKKRWWSKILFQATKRENIKRFFFSFLVLVQFLCRLYIGSQSASKKMTSSPIVLVHVRDILEFSTLVPCLMSQMQMQEDNKRALIFSHKSTM